MTGHLDSSSQCSDVWKLCVLYANIALFSFRWDVFTFKPSERCHPNPTHPRPEAETSTPALLFADPFRKWRTAVCPGAANGSRPVLGNKTGEVEQAETLCLRHPRGGRKRRSAREVGAPVQTRRMAHTSPIHQSLQGFYCHSHLLPMDCRLEICLCPHPEALQSQSRKTPEASETKALMRAMQRAVMEEAKETGQKKAGTEEKKRRPAAKWKRSVC
uniref:uncharacterized protein LOC131104872 isoform X2 n=1 Tax=Doryrhamphus excisus TaxID=161450 RepID=UPI0025AE3B18|nr:uncharacterized protein LOC131104872 isoform X2 [Doryrhamphus excisus]